MMAGKCEFDVTEVGAFTPTGYLPTDELSAGDVGYIAASIKDIADIHVGDTITLAQNPAEKPAARLQARAADGVLRHLPGRRRGV